MTTAYTSLLGLALPVTGELQGTWGDVVNDSITSLLDTAVAGTTSLTTDADTTLSTTSGASNQARQAIILWNPASGTVTRNITAPARSKIYVVINATGGTQSIVFRGVGPTTGVTILAGEKAVVAWNGSDFVKVSTFGGSPSFTNVTVTGTTTLSGLTASTALALNASKEVVSVTNTGTGNNVLSASPTLTGTVAGASMTLSSLTSGRVTYAGTSGLLQDSANFTFNGTDLTVSGAVNAGSVNATTLDLTNIEVTNVKAKDGTSAATIADSTGVVSFTANPVMSGGTANGVTYLNGSKVLTSGSALTFDGTTLKNNTSSTTAPNIRIDNGTYNRVGTFALTVNGVQFDSFDQNSTSSQRSYMWLSGGSEQMRLTSTGLGIGTSSPSTKLEVAVASSGATAEVLRLSNPGSGANTQAQINFYTTSTSYATITGGYGASAPQMTFNLPSATAGNYVWQITNSEVMRLTSTGLGIGTSAISTYGGRLNVYGGDIVVADAGTSSGASAPRIGSSTQALVFKTNSGGGSAAEVMRLDGSGNLGLGVTPKAWTVRALELAGSPSLSSVLGTDLTYNAYYDGAWKYTATAAALRYSHVASTSTHAWYTAASGTANTAISWVTTMQLDASGNLGVGATPSAWASTFKAVQPGAQPVFGSTGTSNTIISSNWYNDGSERYIGTGGASRFITTPGSFLWQIAASGTGGTVASFTQAMTLDASGQLQIGTTTADGMFTVSAPASTGYGSFNAASSGFANLNFKNAGTVYGYLGSANAFITGGTASDFAFRSQNALTFATGGGTERARITSAGNQISFQPAESAQNTSVTLTVANLQTRVITSNAAVTLTLPTGTSLEGYTTSMAADTAFECTFIATTANAITIAANGNTTVGNLTVSGNTSGTFRFRKTALNTFTVYRVA